MKTAKVFLTSLFIIITLLFGTQSCTDDVDLDDFRVEEIQESGDPTENLEGTSGSGGGTNPPPGFN